MVSPGQGGDISLRRVGPHKITIDPEGTPKVAGFTRGNLQLTITPNKRDVMVAEYGSTRIDQDITGVAMTARWTMVERSLKTLDIALNGLYPLNYGSATTSRGIGRSGIIRATDRAKQILLHPLSEGAGTDRDILLYAALITPTGNIELSDQGDQLFEVEADCIIDANQTDGSLLALINEASAGA